MWQGAASRLPPTHPCGSPPHLEAAAHPPFPFALDRHAPNPHTTAHSAHAQHSPPRPPHLC